jgi:hypothetical protein
MIRAWAWETDGRKEINMAALFRRLVSPRREQYTRWDYEDTSRRPSSLDKNVNNNYHHRCYYWTVSWHEKLFKFYLYSKRKSGPSTRHGGAWGERRYSSYSFTTSALDGGEWSESRPGRPLPPEKGPPVPIVQEAGWAPEPVWTQRIRKNPLPLPGIEPRSPGCPARSQTLYCLS